LTKIKIQIILGSTRPNRSGQAVAELLWVHTLIRSDLRTLRAIADEVAGGAPPREMRAEIGSLRTNSPLWKLRVNCLYYCRFVHSHHTGEDASLFPALRRSAAALGPVVDRLEAEHRRVANHLAEVAAAAGFRHASLPAIEPASIVGYLP